jgi:hypothetical protein
MVPATAAVVTPRGGVNPSYGAEGVAALGLRGTRDSAHHLERVLFIAHCDTLLAGERE